MSFDKPFTSRTEDVAVLFGAFFDLTKKLKSWKLNGKQLSTD
jgi:hypothetical protein